jgi:RNA polymerase sigma-70 factor (ECF subfamily)
MASTGSHTDMNDLSDAEVIRAVLAGRTDAFAELVSRHRDAQFRFALRMLGDADDADDALQSAFVRAFRSLASCREPERFGAWLRQIVVNECRTAGTARGRREARLVRDEVVLERLEGSGPEESSLDPEEIERALTRLTPDLREAFLLKHVEDHSYEEMVEITGAGLSALKMRVKRACEQLREQLEGVRDA